MTRDTIHLAMLAVCFLAAGFIIGHNLVRPSAPKPPAAIGSAVSYIPPCPSIAPGNRPGPCVAKP